MSAHGHTKTVAVSQPGQSHKSSTSEIGRSLQDLVGFLAELQASPCELYLHQQGLDTSTPAGSQQLFLAHLFDHLVGDGEQRGRHFEAKRPGHL
jgi:hypothetical protein